MNEEKGSPDRYAKTARERELELELKIEAEKAERPRWWMMFDSDWLLLMVFLIIIAIIEAVTKIAGH